VVSATCWTVWSSTRGRAGGTGDRVVSIDLEGAAPEVAAFRACITIAVGLGSGHQRIAHAAHRADRIAPQCGGHMPTRPADACVHRPDVVARPRAEHQAVQCRPLPDTIGIVHHQAQDAEDFEAERPPVPDRERQAASSKPRSPQVVGPPLPAAGSCASARAEPARHRSHPRHPPMTFNDPGRRDSARSGVRRPQNGELRARSARRTLSSRPLGSSAPASRK
jgi:hypothetical protein